MKQTLNLLISALEKLTKTNKTIEINKLEEEVAPLIKDLTNVIAENQHLKNDADLKDKVNKLGEIIKSLDKNQEQQSKIFSEFMKYLKDRKIN